MHRTNKNYLIRMSWAVAVFAAISISFPVAAQDPQIDVKVSGNKLVFLNSECLPEGGNPAEKGCVEVAKGSKNWIFWELDQGSWSEWDLYALQFSPDGVNWGQPGYPLLDCTMEDFKLAPGDQSSGFASSAEVVGNGKRMKIWDENNNVCTTHYKLIARNRNTGAEIDSDPVIKNRGTH